LAAARDVPSSTSSKMTYELVFLKLGGSLITDKNRPFTPRTEVIGRCARELADALRARPELKVLLGHGSGSFGHYAAARSAFGSGGVTGFAETGAAAARLNRIVVDTCLLEGLAVTSFPPSASAICADGQLIELAERPIEIALREGLVPLVFGDVAFDGTRGESIASTEIVFAYLARRLQPARIVLAGLVNGVFTGDPLRDANAERILRITPSSFPSVRSRLGGSHAVDVTGGMLNKVELMLGLVQAQRNLRIQLISGETDGLLRAALLDGHNDAGTWITADK